MTDPFPSYCFNALWPAEENKAGQAKMRMPANMKMEQAWNDKYAAGAGTLISKLDVGEWYRYFPVPALVWNWNPLSGH